MVDGERGTASSRDTGYNPGEDSYSKWRNVFSILAGQMTPEGKEQYRLARDLRNEEADCKRCEKQRDYLFNYSLFDPLPTFSLLANISPLRGIGPIIRFMSDRITELNGDLNASNVRCRRCPVRQAGGFSPDHGIQICANEMRSQGHLEDTLAHEMMHAYDHLRFKVDWVDLRHAACTEIRASSLSGECRWMREFFTRGQWNITQQHQECVRRRATLSVMNRPACKDDVHAAKVVNEVWDSCFADTRPFDEIYK